ncbi:MAG: hypothetical protein HS111_05910 [Kofleriaceae bacterium]|nr:hypothetical protein [Kofleriaceae bacterium]
MNTTPVRRRGVTALAAVTSVPSVTAAAAAHAALAVATAAPAHRPGAARRGACACEARRRRGRRSPRHRRSRPRWSVGPHARRVVGLAPEGQPEARTEYGGGGLHGRYRLAPRWRLELALEHVTERPVGGERPGRELEAATLAVHYHLRPDARWDGYLIAGVGATADGRPELSDEARRETSAGHVHLGAGVERRFGRDGRFGLAAELRLVGIAPREVEDAATTSPGAPSPLTVPTGELDVAGSSDGRLTIAASYHF